MFNVMLVQVVLLFGSETWVPTPQLEKALEGFYHRAVRRMTDGSHGPQTSTGWDMGVPTHWGGAGNGGGGLYQGVYRPPPEHGHEVHCKSSYHRIVSGGGA